MHLALITRTALVLGTLGGSFRAIVLFLVESPQKYIPFNCSPSRRIAPEVPVFTQLFNTFTSDQIP